MSPLLFLYAAIAATLAAWAIGVARRRRERARLRALAATLGMTYCPGDPLRVADRVAGRLPFPGAACVRVRDLFYGTTGGTRRYVFTAEFTAGVVRMKKRVHRVAAFREAQGREESGGGVVEVVLAPRELAVEEQYRVLARDVV